MRYALVDPAGNVIETGIKLTPLSGECPAGHRWVQDPETPFDAETQTRVPNPVGATDGAITYTVAQKPLAEYLAVMAERATAAVQAHMDAMAQSRGYDDIKSAVTYADEPAVQTFQAEGQAFRTWRSLVWAHCYTLMAQVQAGAPMPTMQDLIASLPEIVLP
jgi:hypothetical protein